MPKRDLTKAGWLRVILKHGNDGGLQYIREQTKLHYDFVKAAVDDLVLTSYVTMVKPEGQGRKVRYIVTLSGHRYLADHADEPDEKPIDEPFSLDGGQSKRHAVPDSPPKYQGDPDDIDRKASKPVMVPPHRQKGTDDSSDEKGWPKQPVVASEVAATKAKKIVDPMPEPQVKSAGRISDADVREIAKGYATGVLQQMLFEQYMNDKINEISAKELLENL